MARATIDDVAAAASVSVATVSRALRGLPHVATATRQHVERVADELDYEINPTASRLATGRTHTIGLIAPWLGTWYTAEIITGAESVFAGAGYDLLVASLAPDSLDPFLSRTRSFGRRIDGAILIDVHVEGGDLDRLCGLGVPMVSLGENLGRFSGVSIDNEEAAFRAVKHLTDLGHRRIGVISGRAVATYSSPVPQRREAGWAAALRDAGIEPDPQLVREGDDTVTGGGRGTAELLALSDPPTAIFCMSDHMAFGALAVAREHGLDVPADLSVVGFDDHDFSEAFGLTTMRQDVLELGRTAAAMVTEQIASSSPQLQLRIHPVELVERKTSGVARTRI